MCSVMRPPRSGPIASAIAETPAQMPSAVPRSRGGKVAVMIESVAGIMQAAPIPGRTRALDQQLRAPGEAAEKRGEREDCEPDQEDEAAGPACLRACRP